MANTDVRISDLSELTLLDSGDFFAVVETGTVNATKKMQFSTVSGQLDSAFSGKYFDPLSDATGLLSVATGYLNSGLSGVSGEVNTNRNNIATNATNITSNDSDISTLQTATGELSTATGQLSLRHLYSVFAEEESSLSTSTSNGFQWSFGNGTRTTSGHGVPIVFASKLVGFGFQGERLGAGNVSVEVYKGATPTLFSGTLTGSDEIFTTGVSPPIDFEAGSTLNFKTNESAGNLDNNIAVAYLVTTNTPFNF
jgi:hypothetical protein